MHMISQTIDGETTEADGGASAPVGPSVATPLAAVTDNTSNITAAISRMEWLHFGCFSHTLQLGVQKAVSLSEVSS